MTPPLWPAGGLSPNATGLALLGLLSPRGAEGSRPVAAGPARRDGHGSRSDPREDRDLAGTAIMRLPPRERAVVVERIFHGHSCAAIARRSGRPETAVRATQLRAVNRLRSLVHDASRSS